MVKVQIHLSPLEIGNLFIERPSLLIHNPLLISNSLKHNICKDTVHAIDFCKPNHPTCFILSNLA